MWVGCKIKTPSWGNAIVFGTACIIILNLPPILILHRPFTAWTIAVVVSGFTGSLAGVLFSGYLARRFERFNPMRKVLRQGIFGIGFLVIAILVVWTAFNAVWDAELKSTLAEIKARGEPMTIAEFVPPAVSSENNAAIELNKAFVLMSSNKTNEQYIPGKQRGKLAMNTDALETYWLKMFPKKIVAEEAMKYLDLIDSPEFTEIFNFLNAAALKPGCNFDLRYEDGSEMMIPHLSLFRTTIRLLSLKALAQANKGNITGACDTLMTAAKASNHLRNEPTLVSALVMMACLAITAETMNNITDNYKIPEKDTRNLIVELDQINTTAPLKKVFIGERVCLGQPTFNGLISGNTKYSYERNLLKSMTELRGESTSRSLLLPLYLISKISIKKDYNNYLKIISSFPPVCDKPFYLAKQDIEIIEADVKHIPRYCLIARMLSHNLTAVFKKHAELRTNLEISKIKLGLNIYKGKYAAYPESLEQLKPDILGDIALDELTGKPLTYKKEGEKYILFSDAVQKLEEERNHERELERQNLPTPL